MTGPPLWVVELAGAFWRAAGEPEPFPRRLLGPILWSPFDLDVEEVAGLTTRAVDAALARRGCPIRCPAGERAVRGCLVAARGGGVIFLDADDDEAERTFTLAHELAHFLADYCRPRHRAAAVLGDAVLDVLDGRRPATTTERFHALLRGVSLGAHLHLMHREPGWVAPEVRDAEADADRLAWELLAPADALADRADLPRVLRTEFGLPADAAAAYARVLRPSAPPIGLLDRLRKSAESRRSSSPRREEEAGGSPR